MPDSSAAGNQLIEYLLAAAGLCAWIALVAQWRARGAWLPWRPRTPVAWSPLVALVVCYIAGIVVPIVVRVAAGSGFDAPPLRYVQNRCLTLALQLVVIPAIVALAASLRPHDFGIFRTAWKQDLLAGGWGYLASLVPVFAMNRLVNVLGWRAPEGVHPFFGIVQHAPGLMTAAWVALAVVVLAPLAEELLFRVVLQGALEARLPPVAAVVLTALAFALIHFAPGRPDALPLFPLALVLGYTYYRRRSYLAVVVLHGLFNAVNLAFALWIYQ